jgi:hypothetical protein
MREILPRLEPLATRQTESNLTRLAKLTGNADRNRGGGGGRRPQGNANRISPGRLLAFLQQEKVGVVVNESSQGDGGTVFVQSASVPSTNAPSTNGPGGRGRGGGGPEGTNADGCGFGPRGPSAYSLKAPPCPLRSRWPPRITTASCACSNKASR